MSSWRSERARLAALKRHHPTDTEAIAAAERDYRSAKFEAVVTAAIENAPPLTDAQCTQLSRLLAGKVGES